MAASRRQREDADEREPGLGRVTSRAWSMNSDPKVPIMNTSEWAKLISLSTPYTRV